MSLDTGIDIWRLAAGLGLFLFGMHQLEQALKLLTGRPFKKFLREYTRHPVRGVIAGAVSTAALQSSSVVSLIVLAFVGTDIISLSSAISIVFGSNLGTTVTGWVFATVGFKFDIEAIALPFVTLGGFGVALSRPSSRRAGASHLLAGFGLMLMGLEFMKSGAINATSILDPEGMRDYPLIVFLGAGLLVTALIQSSSATIMIILSAIYAGAIDLPSAASAAIGANLGTTVTGVLGALAGSVDKKRVAISSIIFNVTTSVIAFASLHLLLSFIGDVIGIRDPLFTLVAFHSIINLAGIVIFLPLIPTLSDWLANRFSEVDVAFLRHINESDLAVPEAGTENLSRETMRLIDQAAALNQLGFLMPVAAPFYDASDDRDSVRLFRPNPDHGAAYDAIKRLEGEILAYATKLQEVRLDVNESERVGQIIVATRNAVHSAKCLKDIGPDLQSFRDAVDDRLNAWFGRFREAAKDFYVQIGALQAAASSAHRFEILVALKSSNEDIHRSLHGDIVREVSVGKLSKLQISTLLNVNRELYLSNQSLLAALADALLDVHGAADYEAIPAGT